MATQVITGNLLNPSAQGLTNGMYPAGSLSQYLEANSVFDSSQTPVNMGMGMGMQQPMGQVSGMNTPNVQSIQFPNLMGGSASTEQGNIGLIMDVFMEMTVELGRTKKQIKEILGMGEGTIIELDKIAGEPIDVLVNGKFVAKGEVVVIEESFGVRVTEIVK